jgi:CubicO group peptidase (beta-lactamase class C family)
MRYVCLLLSLLFSAGSAAGFPGDDAIPVPRFTDPGRRAKLQSAFPAIEKAFDRYRIERRIPGLVFGVVIDGELSFVKGLGVRDVESGAPADADTVFRIASMTKSFTALAVLKLRDEGKLSLDDPASRWIPELEGFRYPTSDTPPITIRQLLTHGAGFPEDNPWGDRQLATDEPTLLRWLRAGLPFSTPPGTAYEYSNYGFALLGRIVQLAAGVPYAEYLRTKILLPLGMKATTLESSVVPKNVRAQGYRLAAGGYEKEPSLPHGTFGAMGGLLTSARDLSSYVAFQLSGFPSRSDEDRGPVRRSSIREMQHGWRPLSLSVDRPAPDAAIRATAGAYGYGLIVRQDCRFGRIVSHGGGLPGFGSNMTWLPDYGVGIFSMANLTYAGPSRPADEALDALRQTGALKPRELPPSAALAGTRDSLVGLWDRWDEVVAAAIAADNLFMDRPSADIAREIARLKTELGSCRPEGSIEPENLLRGRFRLACERGFVDTYFTLAPTQPPKVQSLRYAASIRPGEAVSITATSLAALVKSPAEEKLAAIADPSLDTGLVMSQLRALGPAYGACRTGALLGGNGKDDLRIRFDCDRGPLDVQLTLNPAGKLRAASFRRPSDVPCVP